MTELLEVRELAFSYGDEALLKNIHLWVETGEMVGLIGPNGAGKSTLMRLIAGTLKADRGSIYIDGQVREQWPGRELAKRIAYLAQAEEAHWPISVRRLAMLGRLPHLGLFRWTTPQDRAAVTRALETMDLVKLADRKVTTLSGGERSRALLARALSVEAKLLLADEPVQGLDPRHQIALMDSLADQAKEGRSVIVVMHDLALAARYCSRIILLVDGAILNDGDPERVLNKENMERAFGVDAVIGREDGKLYVVPWSRTKDKAANGEGDGTAS